MNKGAYMSWEDIQKEFDTVSQMSCKPRFSKVLDNYVFDENQSVKWNKEQVEKNNQRYDDEVACLRLKKRKAHDDVLDLIYDKIRYEILRETGHTISHKKAQEIWTFAYERGHAYGFASIQSELSDLIGLVIILLKDDSIEVRG